MACIFSKIFSCGSSKNAILPSSSPSTTSTPSYLGEVVKTTQVAKSHAELLIPFIKPLNSLEESTLIETLNLILQKSFSGSQFLESVKNERLSKNLPKVKIKPATENYLVTGGCYIDEIDEIWLTFKPSPMDMLAGLVFEYGNAKRKKQLAEVSKKLRMGHYESGLQYAEARERVEYETYIERAQVFDRFCNEHDMSYHYPDPVLQKSLKEAAEDISGPKFNMSYATFWKFSLLSGHVKLYVDFYNRYYR